MELYDLTAFTKHTSLIGRLVGSGTVGVALADAPFHTMRSQPPGWWKGKIRATMLNTGARVSVFFGLVRGLLRCSHYCRNNSYESYGYFIVSVKRIIIMRTFPKPENPGKRVSVLFSSHYVPNTLPSAQLQPLAELTNAQHGDFCADDPLCMIDTCFGHAGGCGNALRRARCRTYPSRRYRRSAGA